MTSSSAPHPLVLKRAYRWTPPSTWQRNWTARCNQCKRLFDVPTDPNESWEVTGLLISHYRAHVREDRLQGGPG
jgi:hypothetical protein